MKIDFKNTEFGTKFIRKQTGEICELIAKTQVSAHLRPIDYKGLMSYSENFGCPNEQTDWEIYEEKDDWNALHYKVNIPEIDYKTPKSTTTSRGDMYIRGYVDGFDLFTIQTLKEKILQDFCDLKNVKIEKNLCYASYDDIENIINKRFGF